MAQNPLQAWFNGQQPFGDPAQFACADMVGDGPSIDAFLGNAGGTTVGPPMQMVAISGVLTGTSQVACEGAVAALQAMAGISAPLGLPTGIPMPGVNFRWIPGYCYFRPEELVVDAVTAVPGNQYQAAYKMVFRRA